MPITLNCSSCGLSFFVGSFHGRGDEWRNALYCRHCGANYVLEQTIEQCFGVPRSKEEKPKEWRYVLRRRREQVVEIIVSADSPAPVVECQECGAKGPFGNMGPITDEPPPGMDGDGWMLAQCGLGADGVGVCPRCKQSTLKITGRWIT